MPSFAARFRSAVSAEFARQPPGPARPLEERDLDRLPPVVARYARASGSVGRPVPRNMRVVFEAQMVRAPGRAPMPARSVQYNFFEHPARFFLMRARMFGLPVRALHMYREGEATFQVRAASLATLVDLSGEQLSAAETVTVLNDLCVFAPGALVDRRLEWGAANAQSADVMFTNASHAVRATLTFDSDARLVDFSSDDRPETREGRLVPARWHTPLQEYRQASGISVASVGSAVYQRESGPFAYGRFHLRGLEFDLMGPPWGSWTLARPSRTSG